MTSFHILAIVLVVLADLQHEYINPEGSMHIPKFITESEDYQACARFHGHTCMGLTIGYLAAKLALDHLHVCKARDEELIVIVENDACCCDAIQVLTGCTFGKGNFFFQDKGKMAFTFGRRDTGKSIRLLFKKDILAVPEEEQRLASLIRREGASVETVRAYEKISEKRINDLFAFGPDAFFIIQQKTEPLPMKATIAPSSPCSQCGEMVMNTKLEQHAGSLMCCDCVNN